MIQILLLFLCVSNYAADISVQTKKDIACLLCNKVEVRRFSHILTHFTVQNECFFCDTQLQTTKKDERKKLHADHIKAQHLFHFLGLHLYFFNILPQQIHDIYRPNNYHAIIKQINEMIPALCYSCNRAIHPLCISFHILEKHFLKDGQCIQCGEFFPNAPNHSKPINWLKAYKHAQGECKETFMSLLNTCFKFNFSNETFVIPLSCRFCGLLIAHNKVLEMANHEKTHLQAVQYKPVVEQDLLAHESLPEETVIELEGPMDIQDALKIVDSFLS
jgi:hypothetical protein